MADQLGAKSPVRDETDSESEIDETPEVDIDGDAEAGDTDLDDDDEFSAGDLFAPGDDVDDDDLDADDDDEQVTGAIQIIDEPDDEPDDEPVEESERPSVAVVRSAPDSDSGRTGVADVLQRLGVRARGQLRARKVQRIVRRVDPWSVLKLSLIFYFCVWLMVVVSGVLLWGAAVGSGTISSLESFIAEFLAFEEFSFNGDQLFQIFALGGLIGVFVATAATAVLAVLFNLIADLTGGIRFTVIEEESARRIIDQR